MGELERLRGEVAGGGEDEGADAGAGVAVAEALEHGHEEGSGLAGARAGHGGDVEPREDERHRLALDGRGHAVALVAHPAVDLLAEPHGLEPARLGLLVVRRLRRLLLARRLRLHLRPPPRLAVRRGGGRGVSGGAGLTAGRHGWEAGRGAAEGRREMVWVQGFR